MTTTALAGAQAMLAFYDILQLLVLLVLLLLLLLLLLF